MDGKVLLGRRNGIPIVINTLKYHFMEVAGCTHGILYLCRIYI